MLSDYTFLNDHSYSLRPVADDNDELPLNRREVKNPKRPRSSNRTNKTTLSIDRSSSDKENNSLILSNTTDTPISAINRSVNTTKSSTKKKTIGSRRSRLSPRTTMTNSRTQSSKKQDNKTSVKSTQGSIVKKKKTTPRGSTKLLSSHQLDSNDAPPSLSIEERVKLRRTKPIQSSLTKPVSRPTKTLTHKQDLKQIRQTINDSTKKTKKLFLGSGLDLDNIVPGNRQRRCVQT